MVCEFDIQPDQRKDAESHVNGSMESAGCGTDTEARRDVRRKRTIEGHAVGGATEAEKVGTGIPRTSLSRSQQLLWRSIERDAFVPGKALARQLWKRGIVL